jgi:hypothetical protein
VWFVCLDVVVQTWSSDTDDLVQLLTFKHGANEIQRVVIEKVLRVHFVVIQLRKKK